MRPDLELFFLQVCQWEWRAFLKGTLREWIGFRETGTLLWWWMADGAEAEAEVVGTGNLYGTSLWWRKRRTNDDEDLYLHGFSKLDEF